MEVRYWRLRAFVLDYLTLLHQGRWTTDRLLLAETQV